MLRLFGIERFVGMAFLLLFNLLLGAVRCTTVWPVCGKSMALACPDPIQSLFGFVTVFHCSPTVRQPNDRVEPTELLDPAFWKLHGRKKKRNYEDTPIGAVGDQHANLGNAASRCCARWWRDMWYVDIRTMQAVHLHMIKHVVITLLCICNDLDFSGRIEEKIIHH